MRVRGALRASLRRATVGIVVCSGVAGRDAGGRSIPMVTMCSDRQRIRRATRKATGDRICVSRDMRASRPSAASMPLMTPSLREYSPLRAGITLRNPTLPREAQLTYR